MANNYLRHGGDLSTAAATFGTPANGWLDLSTGINPVAYPVSDLPDEIWHRLPVKSDEDRLLAAARVYYGIPDDAALIAAPGTQAIIQWLPIMRPHSRVQVLGPTYEEHASVWAFHGHSIKDLTEIDATDADVMVIVNPNNPNGRVFPPNVLLDFADHQAARDGILIIDEAFADVMPEISVAARSGRPGLLILRSFGKFFGLAGMRLGFAIGTDSDIAMLGSVLGPWSVAGPALVIGAAALGDTTWHAKTRTRLSADAERLDDILKTSDMEIIGGTSLYRLARTTKAEEFHQKLGRAGILVRIFDKQTDWLRFGLPGSEDGWRRLEKSL